MPHANARSVTAVDSHIQSTPAAMTKTTNAPAQPAAAPAAAGDDCRKGATSTATSSAPRRDDDEQRARKPRLGKGFEIDRMGVAHRVRPARRAIPLELERSRHPIPSIG